MKKILLSFLVLFLTACAANPYTVVTTEPVEFNGEYSNVDLLHPSNFIDMEMVKLTKYHNTDEYTLECWYGDYMISYNSMLQRTKCYSSVGKDMVIANDENLLKNRSPLIR